MISLLFGAIALVALLLLLRLFVGADPKALAKSLRVMGAILLGLAALGFAAMERLSLAVVLAGMAWAVYTGGRFWPGINWRFRYPIGGGGPRTDQISRVRTAWLEMELDHASGTMTGHVLQGAHSGKTLDAMPQAALVAFYREAGAADAETARLLEAYLDRRFGNAWRKASSGKPRGRDAGMSREEAFKVLGLEEGASGDDIRAAHRRLMMQNHPDKGGSDYLAAKINEAKDVLLD